VNTKTTLSSPETAARVLAYLRRTATDGRASASCNDLAAALGIGPSTAHRATRRLIRDHRISVVRLGTGNAYPTTYDVWGWPT
jgi:DNA-binding MarR family transcriptional regulator